MTDQSERKKGKKELKFSQEQYDMLLRCSEKKDVTEWNEWRKNNPNTEVLLDGAVLLDAHLKGANLRRAHLEGAKLSGAQLEGVNLRRAYLEGVDIGEAHLNGAHLWGAHLEGAYIGEAHLERANLSFTHMEDASFFNAHLEDADLSDTHIEDAYFFQAHLEGTNFAIAILNDKTLIWNCTVDRKTNFRGVGLGNVRIDPGTRALLEYNIRRMNWEDWYKKHPVLRWPVRCFWELSDYGHSTGRILLAFLGAALLFASVYTVFPGLMAGVSDGSFIHNLYISVTAMTSLGLSVGATGKGCAARYCLLMLQYIFGYAILGALITRLSILFTTGGPSGDFAAEKTLKSPNESDGKGNA